METELVGRLPYPLALLIVTDTGGQIDAVKPNRTLVVDVTEVEDIRQIDANRQNPSRRNQFRPHALDIIHEVSVRLDYHGFDWPAEVEHRVSAWRSPPTAGGATPESTDIPRDVPVEHTLHGRRAAIGDREGNVPVHHYIAPDFRRSTASITV